MLNTHLEEVWEKNLVKIIFFCCCYFWSKHCFKWGGFQLNFTSYIMAMYLCILCVYRMCRCPKCHDCASGSCWQYLADGHRAASPLETSHNRPRPPRVCTLPKCTFTGALWDGENSVYCTKFDLVWSTDWSLYCCRLMHSYCTVCKLPKM